MVSSIASMPALPASERALGIVAAVVAAAALAVAFTLEALLDLPPCSLCIDQRWAYVAALALGAAAGLSGNRPGIAAVLAGLAGVAFFVGAGIAAFHLGVEHGWWSSGGACTGVLPELDITQLQQRLQNLQEPSCDEVRWRLFGMFSLAEMNAVASLVFGILTFTALARIRRRG